MKISKAFKKLASGDIIRFSGWDKDFYIRSAPDIRLQGHFKIINQHSQVIGGSLNLTINEIVGEWEVVKPVKVINYKKWADDYRKIIKKGFA